MATTNMQQWNPTASNQENDSAYTADSQRAGGATDPSVFLSALANKVFFQSSTYLTALFTAFAAKGFTTSDSNISTLAAQCANFLTTADLRALITNLPYSPTPVLDGSKTNAWFLLLDGDITIPTIAGLSDGQIVTFVYLQDATGGHTVTFPTQLFEAAQPDPAANSCSAQAFIYTTAAGGFFRATGPLISESTTFTNKLQVRGTLNVVGVSTLGVLALTSPGAVGQVLTHVGGGVFQPEDTARVQGSITDLTGSRVFGVDYENLTGGIIYVSGNGVTGGSSTGSLSAFVGSASPSTKVYGMEYTATVAGAQAGFGFMVPAGHFYRVDVTGTVGGTPTWVETQIS